MDTEQINQLLTSAQAKLKTAIENQTSADLTQEEMTVLYEEIKDTMVIPFIDLADKTQVFDFLTTRDQQQSGA